MRLKLKRNYNFNDHHDAIRMSAKALAETQPLSSVKPVPSALAHISKGIHLYFSVFYCLSFVLDFLLESMGTEADAGRPDLTKVDEDDQPIVTPNTGETTDKPVYVLMV